MEKKEEKADRNHKKGTRMENLLALTTAQLAEQGTIQQELQIMAKGPNFVYGKEYIFKVHGTEVWDYVIRHMEPQVAKIWDGKLLTLGEYPFSAFKQMIYILSHKLNIMTNIELASMYEYIADQSLNNLYRMFFKMTKPSFVINNYPMLWQRFFNTGVVEVPIAEKEYAEIKFMLPEIFLDWLPAASLGYSKKAIQLAGGSQVSQTLLDKHHLPNDLWLIVYELKWKEEPLRSFRLSK